MKVLQIAPKVPYPLKDGSKIGIFNLTKQYLKAGYEVHFAAPLEDGERVEKGFTSLVDFTPLPEVKGYSIPGGIRNLFSSYPYNLERYFDESTLGILGEVYGKGDFDFVHVDHLHMARYGAALKELYGAKFVLREHNFESEIMGRVSTHHGNPVMRSYAKLQHSRMLKLESGMLEKADIVLPISDVDESKILGLVPEARTFVVPAGVDIEKYTPAQNPQGDRVLFLSSFDWLPNIDSFRYYMRKIAPELHKIAPQIRTLVAGKATDKLPASEVAEGCEVIGYIENFNDFASMAAIGVIPLRIGSGIRIKLLEMMALGMAVVSTSVGAEGIDVRDGEHVMLADSPEEFVEKIVYTSSNPEIRKKLGENARKLVSEKYSWDSVGNKLIEACNSIL